MHNEEGEKLDFDLWLKNPKTSTNESKNKKEKSLKKLPKNEIDKK